MPDRPKGLFSGLRLKLRKVVPTVASSAPSARRDVSGSKDRFAGLKPNRPDAPPARPPVTPPVVDKPIGGVTTAVPPPMEHASFAASRDAAMIRYARAMTEMLHLNKVAPGPLPLLEQELAQAAAALDRHVPGGARELRGLIGSEPSHRQALAGGKTAPVLEALRAERSPSNRIWEDDYRPKTTPARSGAVEPAPLSPAPRQDASPSPEIDLDIGGHSPSRDRHYDMDI